MAKPKPVQARLSDLTPGQLGDFFAAWTVVANVLLNLDETITKG